MLGIMSRGTRGRFAGAGLLALGLTLGAFDVQAASSALDELEIQGVQPGDDYASAVATLLARGYVAQGEASSTFVKLEAGGNEHRIYITEQRSPEGRPADSALNATQIYDELTSILGDPDTCVKPLELGPEGSRFNCMFYDDPVERNIGLHAGYDAQGGGMLLKRTKK